MGKVTALWVGVASWSALPLVALVLLTSLSLHATITGPQQPAWVPVRASSDVSSEPVDLALSWSESRSAFAPSWSGLVQSVPVQPGDVLRDGTPLAVIDGITRVAALTPAPLYRPISYGMRGDDVSWLNSFLSRLGVVSVDESLATWATMSGVESFAKSIGADYHGSFDPAWVVFVPSAEFQVKMVDLTPGKLAPAAGGSILTSTSTLVRATVVNFGSLGDGASQPSPNTLALPVPLDNATIRENAKEIPAGSTIQINGEVLSTDSNSVVDEAGTSVIESLVKANSLLLQVNLVRTARPGDMLIPTAALFSGASGKSCVIVRVGQRESTLRLQVVADAGQQLIVEGDLTPAMSVRVPARQGAQCG